MRSLLLLACAALVCAQGTDPKAKAADYEVHAARNGVEIGAEYMVHSFSGEGQTFLIDDYLVVEVALFPPKGGSVTAGAGAFQLRIDGKAATLRAAAPAMAAASLQHRGWERRRGVEAVGGVGEKVVVVGGPPYQRPPYGPPEHRLPAPPRAPEPDYRGNVPPRDPVREDELLVKVALPEGDFQGPVSGYLYFPFRGNASKIRSVDLLYEGATLKLK